STSTFEPDGTAGTPAQQAAKMPDYISYCTDCHNTVNTIYSSTLGRNLYKIDWFSNNGDKHGFRVADSAAGTTDTNTASLGPPFSTTTLPVNDNGAGFVLSCMDCHEAHGSGNPFLIREEVNGIEVKFDGEDNQIGWLCRACHRDDHSYDSSQPRNTWHHIHHGAGPSIQDPPYPNPRRCASCHGRPLKAIKCTNCHFHGSTDAWLQSVAPEYYTGRRTF
ncbi:cytochrome c3 family protein, partial [Desulfurobacterium sp.]